jgi:hypothetical protein
MAPRWSKDGKRLFYFQAEDLMEVPITPGPPMQFGTARKLFTHKPVGLAIPPLFTEGYDVAGDPERFLMVQAAGDGESGNSIAVVQNWYEEFRQDR